MPAAVKCFTFRDTKALKSASQSQLRAIITTTLIKKPDQRGRAVGTLEQAQRLRERADDSSAFYCSSHGSAACRTAGRGRHARTYETPAGYTARVTWTQLVSQASRTVHVAVLVGRRGPRICRLRHKICAPAEIERGDHRVDAVCGTCVANAASPQRSIDSATPLEPD